MKIQLLKANEIIDFNKAVCKSVNQESVCVDKEKVESALGAAFYPGVFPFRYGGIAKMAGVLCFFLIKAHAFLDGNKRTALLASTIFMNMNGYELRYPLWKNQKSALTNIIEKTAASQVNKEALILWYDRHKYSTKKQTAQKNGKVTKSPPEKTHG